MADNEWAGTNLVQRAFDSFRPSRLRRLFQSHTVSRRPCEPFEQPSEGLEHTRGTRITAHSESMALEETINTNPLDENGEVVGPDLSKATPDNTSKPPHTNKPDTKAYDAGSGSGNPPCTEGSSRIVMTDDGSKNCLALLLTSAMITDMNEVLSGTRKVNRLEYQIDELNRENTHAEIDLEYFLADIEALSEGPDRAVKEANIRRNMKDTEERSQQAAARKKVLEEALHWEKRNQEFSHDKIREIFQEALSEARLLEVDEQSAELEEEQPKGSEIPCPQNPGCSNESVETIISTDELNRRVTYEEVETCRQRFLSLKDEFGNREAFYDSEFRDYQEVIADGSCVVSQSEFDRIFVRNISVLTRALIDAEAAYEDALRRARALRIIGNDFDQESDFVDHKDDGYRESFEADLAAGADRFFIHQWMEVTEESENQEDDPLIDETDEWNARPVEISDSISMVAEGRDRVRIDRWCKTSGL